MHEFTISPVGLGQLKKKIVKRLLFLGIPLTILLLIFVMRSDSAWNNVNDWLPILLLIMVVISFSFYSAIKRQMKMFEKYKLIISQDEVSREVGNTPTITIPITKIKEIIKAHTGAISILGDSKLSAIGIPAEIDKMEEIELLLSNIKPLTIKTSPSLIEKYYLVVVFLPVIFVFSLLHVEDSILSSIGGILFIALMIYGFVVMQKSKNIDRRMKRMSYIVWIPILSFLAAIISKLFQ